MCLSGYTLSLTKALNKIVSLLAKLVWTVNKLHNVTENPNNTRPIKQFCYEQRKITRQTTKTPQN